MTTTQAREAVEFAVIMTRETAGAGVTPTQLIDLMQLAKRHHRLCERLCNEADEDGRLETAKDRTAVRIAKLCAEIGPGITPVFSGDPRGCTVKLKVPSGRTNDWGAVGVCVPQ